METQCKEGAKEKKKWGSCLTVQTCMTKLGDESGGVRKEYGCLSA
jgi:hypothetical protein